MPKNRNARRPHPNGRREAKPEWKLILRELEHGACDVADIAAVIGFTGDSSRVYLKAMEQAGFIRVSGFVRNRRGHPAKLYCLADGKRSAKFRPFTRYERVRKTRANKALNTPLALFAHV